MKGTKKQKMWRTIVGGAVVLCAWTAAVSRGQSPREFAVLSEGSRVLVLSADGRRMIEIGLVSWGPNWNYSVLSGRIAKTGDGAAGRFAQAMPGTGVPYAIELSLRPLGARQLEIQASFVAERETALTQTVLSVRPGDALHGAGRAIATDAEGSRAFDLPFGRGAISAGLRRLELQDGAGRVFAIAFDDPAEVGMDGEARIVLAKDRAPAGEKRTVKAVLHLPADADFPLMADAIPAPPNADQWFEWTGTGRGEGSVFDMSDWLDQPAGRQGRIAAKGDQLIYGGRPIKLWGLNLCYSSCAPDTALAERRAAFYARYGINAVRLHKYADGPGWAGLCSDSAAAFDPAKLDRMDYFVAQLKARGIFVKLSANFGALPIGPADQAKIPFAHEIPARQGEAGWRLAGQGMLWFSSELQDLQAAQVANILTHHNPHTGMRYADDPAVAFVELVNENSIFFYTTLGALQSTPTIRRRAGEAFFQWLVRKYGTEEKLIAAWGEGQIGTFTAERLADEGWERGVIYPVGNPWFFDPDQLNGSQRARRARLLDTMAFFHEQQLAAYRRMVAAIRATGYTGEITASNWQAGRGFSHFLNLDTDAQIGMVDRHNYFAGTGSMLAVPGGGILSTGMQQVAERPFMLSEWIHEFPSEFVHEGPALIGAYGMGLNGWDVSFIFQNGDDGGFRRELKERWDAVVPQAIGLFPAIARQIYRGDVDESPVVFARNVHVESLKRGEMGFEDRVKMLYDVKEFGADVLPAAGLAAGRCVARYTPTPQPTDKADLRPYLHNDGVRSATGQLWWKPGANARDGYFTIDTPGTQAAVGFLPSAPLRLQDVTLTCRAPFAAVYVTALSPTGTLARDSRLLVTALARVRNRGMRMVAGQMAERGGPPLMIEPLRLTLDFARKSNAVAHILDHEGRRTGRTLDVANGQVTLDSADTKAIYYEIEYR